MKHTKGPWEVAGHGDGNKQLPILANGKIIAAIRDDGSLADAHLIAAAPDLLEACELALYALHKAQQYTKKDLTEYCSLVALKQIIAKAKGE